ncbi:MAG TPA: helix-turn-helix domain-containing protein [Candidatus Dormibacteraeota bacterium]|nr:helix-turn-helix domain-containing protein [Candidatus Dormibacteraeota bacterium]
MKNTSLRPLEVRAGCIASAMEVIGNKWTALILRDLFTGPRRFCELEKSVSKINPRTLSQRLDDLEAYEIITKQRFHEVPPRIEYALTPKGQDLLPILEQMADWGGRYYSQNPVN